jgi:hypothetical protein
MPPLASRGKETSGAPKSSIIVSRRREEAGSVNVGEAIAYILGCEGVDTLIGYPVSPLTPTQAGPPALLEFITSQEVSISMPGSTVP